MRRSRWHALCVLSDLWVRRGTGRYVDFEPQEISLPSRGAGKSRAGGGITLKLLIDEKIVFPGENVLSVEYKGATNLATLTSDGRIECVVRIS